MNFIILIFLGITWGLSFSLGKISLLGGATAIGLTFWQSLVAGILLLTYVYLKHKKFHIPIYMFKHLIILSLLAVVIPNFIFYNTATHIDAGILSISVSLIPLFTYGFALFLKMDKFSFTRITGLLIGFVALLVLIVPENSLPDKTDVPWILFSLISAVCYALENIYIDKLNPTNFGPIRLACALSILSAIITFPISLITNQFFIPNILNLNILFAILGLGIITAGAYSIFVYLIGKAGSVFASQTGYLVTFFGILWGMILLNEKHSYFVWITVILIIFGIFLVKPRKIQF